jgi:hypothetical protein
MRARDRVVSCLLGLDAHHRRGDLLFQVLLIDRISQVSEQV